MTFQFEPSLTISCSVYIYPVGLPTFSYLTLPFVTHLCIFQLIVHYVHFGLSFSLELFCQSHVPE
jgi:hypothetical protein